MEVSLTSNTVDARTIHINTTSTSTSSSTTALTHQHSTRNYNRNNAASAGMHISASNILTSPYLSTLLEYTGIINRPTTTSTTQSNAADSNNNIINHHHLASYYSHSQDHAPDGAEVSISIAQHDHSTPPPASLHHSFPQTQNHDAFPRSSDSLLSSLESHQQHHHGDYTTTELPAATTDYTNSPTQGGPLIVNHTDSSSSYYQRYDIQQAARWIEQIIPFTLLLLIVFVRQHLEGFCVTACIAGIMFKSNDVVRKQTALKSERIIFVLIGISFLLTLPIFGIYWWYRNDYLFYPLVMMPPKAIPPFWHVIFVIMVNDTMVRQAAMVIKCMVLVYHKNSRGRDYRRQGRILTLVEYLLLLYRALLPAPVWYRFFLNKEHGSLFSSLMTGLYLTFKLTSVIEKVQSFIIALKSLSQKDIHYGAYATSEQVIAAGDLCAICQEKMHAPILLRCNHIFCEDCVSEWFERERTCPLCRALVKPLDLISFGDGSTSLFFQLF